jgi:hypothetical protein
MAINQRAILSSAVFLIVLAWVIGNTIQTRRRASNFLRDALNLQLQTATFEQVRELAETHRGESSTNCNPQRCVYSFDYENTWLRFLRLAPLTRLTCTLRVKDARLDLRECLFISGNTSASFSASVWEMSRLPEGEREPFYTTRQWSGGRWRVHVALTPDATPEQHRMAYGLNLACLSKIGGCEDAQQLLPSVGWTNTSTNRTPGAGTLYSALPLSSQPRDAQRSSRGKSKFRAGRLARRHLQPDRGSDADARRPEYRAHVRPGTGQPCRV